MKSFVLSLALLCFWRLQEGVNGYGPVCSCPPRHPQQQFCRSDVVLRAKVVGVTFGRAVKYGIHQTRVFKGPKRIFDVIHTPPKFSACGAHLKVGVEYLFMAKLRRDGSLRINFCHYFQPWRTLSPIQRRLLNHYPKGCGCKIRLCKYFPCIPKRHDVCLWSDKLKWGPHQPNQAQNFACVKRRRTGDCFWKKPQVRPGRHPS
ncbi:metalloproteinase inhibitor 2-like [Syngnathoides biaculeatus]|uniref:metalloproteinase inhibitor 2-like n=1 Tax=Syngnathoides biaculeatus TaxID=300417 RepID=UPI002ADE8857|nr:metalloproteinase inhibitor 2-like [Syngnathoides biaculeatus]